MALAGCREAVAPPASTERSEVRPAGSATDEDGPGDTCSTDADCVVANVHCPCGRCPDQPPVVLNRRGARRAERDDALRCPPPGGPFPNCAPCSGLYRGFEPACLAGRCAARSVDYATPPR
jgi:hypothetical protein